MTTQIAVNATAIRNLAHRLTQLGYSGDDVHDVAERIAMNLLADGYRRLEQPVPLKPTNVATPAQRRAALDHIRATLTNRETA